MIRAAWIVVAISLAFARAATAETCCVGGICEDLGPAECVATGGLLGYCRLDEACGAAACDAAAIVPIDDLQVTRSGPDVVLRWTPDADANAYRIAWAVEPASVADCDAPWFPDVGWPSTVPQWVHERAVTGAVRQVFFYCVRSTCTLEPPTGACCTAFTCQADLTRTDCESGGGTWLGPGTDCAGDPCAAPTGACCDGTCCEAGTTQADCEGRGGTFLGAGTDCAGSPCSPAPPTGACCDETSCLDGMLHADCRALDGAWSGVGSSCATQPCTWTVADVGSCLVSANVMHFDGDVGEYIHPGTDTVTDATWSATASPRFVHVGNRPTDRAQGLWWDARFSSEELGTDLAIGVYDDAMRWPFEDPGHPGLSVSGDGRGCNRLTGRFEILALTRDCSGALEAFTATWVQHCEGGTRALRGCVHYER